MGPRTGLQRAGGTALAHCELGGYSDMAVPLPCTQTAHGRGRSALEPLGAGRGPAGGSHRRPGTPSPTTDQTAGVPHAALTTRAAAGQRHLLTWAACLTQTSTCLPMAFAGHDCSGARRDRKKSAPSTGQSLTLRVMTLQSPTTVFSSEPPPTHTHTQ